MREYDVWDQVMGEYVDVIYGYNFVDARKRRPEYSDEKRYQLKGGCYID